MGAVWLADHLALHTQVVVKFIAADLARSKDAMSRFEREAAAASQVKSPHVVQILDYGVTEAGNAPFIVMELLEGHDLAQHIEKFGRLDLVQVGNVVAQLCRALARAHERGIVHRDIKPQNIFLCDAGSGELFVKLLDFGIAKGASVQKLDESTKTGTLVGSPYYMSPEQLVGAKDIDFQTDLWSTAVVAFEAMTGTRAFDGETVGALALRIHNDPLPVPSTRCAASPAVDAWFLRACARDPKQRFGSAKELADAFVTAIGEAKSVLTSSGAALARSGDDPMELARTIAETPTPSSGASSGSSQASDARVLTYSGVATSTRSRASRNVYGALAVVGFFVVAFFATRWLRTQNAGPARAAHEPNKVVSVATTHEAQKPPPPESATETVPMVSAASAPTRAPASHAPTHAASVQSTAPVNSAPAQPTHTAKPSSEDDIK